jgi:hypothetical protein
VFYFFMLSIASKSTDPAVLMQNRGERFSGVVCGLAIAMIVFGLVGKKV